jgi:Amt family ammonium transporter
LLLIWGGLPPHKARRVTPLAVLAVALATLGYWAVGFALHMGGAHAINPDDPALAGLDMLFAPLGAEWGLAGITGFFLAGAAATPTVYTLYLAYLPIIAAAVTLVALALSDARRWLTVAAGLLTGAVIVPVAACWMWGSGWLAHLGATLSLGHGFTDFGGSALLLWLPGMLALGLLIVQPRRAPEPPTTPPPAHFPLLANLGVLFLGIGWCGWTLAGPFHLSGVTWDVSRAALSALLGMAGATLTAQLYAWLVTGELESLLAARGIAAGWGAVLAGAPFLSPWAALIVGLLAGLLFSLLLYVIEMHLHLRDASAAVALGLTGGLWGLLGVGLFADGRAGQGLNGIGAIVGSDPGLGVSGVIVGGNGGQLQAQLVGIVAIGLWGLMWGVLLGFLGRQRQPQITTPIVDEDAAPSLPHNPPMDGTDTTENP